MAILPIRFQFDLLESLLAAAAAQSTTDFYDILTEDMAADTRLHKRVT